MTVIQKTGKFFLKQQSGEFYVLQKTGRFFIKEIATAISPTSVTEPTAQPTNLVFSSLSSSGMTLTWTASVGGADGYLVIRRSGASPTFVPVDQAEYTVSQSVGDGVVAYVGSAVTFADSGLTSDTVYYYDIFAYNGTTGTYNYLSTSPLEGNQYTYSAEPTAQPTSLQFANITTTSIDLSWTAASPVPTGYIVLRRTGASPTGTPTDSATAYNVGDTIGDSTVEYVGTGTSFTDSGLSDSTTYYYDVMSYNGANWYNYLTTSPLEGSQATAFNFGNCLHFDGSNDRVDLNTKLTDGLTQFTIMIWFNPDTSNVTRCLFDNQGAANANGIAIRHGGDSSPNFLIANGSLAQCSLLSNTFTNGVWHAFGIVYDGSQSTNATKLKMYTAKIGTDVSMTQRTVTFTGTVPTSVGNAPNNSKFGARSGSTPAQFLDGCIDEFAFWNVADPTLLTNMFNGGSGSPPSQTNLLRYYRFNSSNNSTTVTDETGNDTGTAVNLNFDANSGWGAH